MKKKVRKSTQSLKLKNLLMLLVSGTVNAFGVTMFLTPVGLYDSGISGTSMLLGQLTPPWLTLSVFLVVLNVPLFLYGLKKQGFAKRSEASRKGQATKKKRNPIQALHLKRLAFIKWYSQILLDSVGKRDIMLFLALQKIVLSPI